MLIVNHPNLQILEAKGCVIFCPRKYITITTLKPHLR
jgi:hypothetical protein